MNAIMLLKENPEPVTSADSNLPRVILHEGDSTPGCTCDHWGHPCKSRLERNRPSLSDRITKEEVS